jgi:hypothetical protein
MNGILDLHDNNNTNNRMAAITKYIIDEVMHPKKGDEFLILDPYIDPMNDIYEPLEKKAYDQILWVRIINELCVSMDLGVIRIIVKQAINVPLLIQAYPVFIPHRERPNCQILVVRYPDPDERNHSQSNQYFPKKLHDRWLLKKTHTPIGLHIGPSFNNLEKDVTMTTFDYQTLNLAIKRFDDIWQKANQMKIR